METFTDGFRIPEALQMQPPAPSCPALRPCPAPHVPPPPHTHTVKLPSMLGSIPAFFSPSCRLIHLPPALLFTELAPSPPSGLRLNATSCRKPSWCLWSQLPCTDSHHAEESLLE